MKALIKSKEQLGWTRDGKLSSLAGQWVTVETDSLFDNQYNIKEHNLRIFDGDIERIVNDARIGKGKCAYCGTLVKSGNKCHKYRTPEKVYGVDSSPNECDIIGINLFNEKNCYFIKYPMGFNHTLKFYKKLSKEPLKIGSYSLEFDGHWFTLSNSRKRFKFKYDGVNFINYSSCGFYMRKKLDVPSSVMTKVKNVLIEGVK